MKKSIERTVPILLAFGLWIVGNTLVSSSSVRGQEVASNNVFCVSNRIKDYISQCPPKPVGGMCTGNWHYIEYDAMTCTGNPSQDPCYSVPHAPVAGVSSSGYCYTDSTSIPNNTYCRPGSPIYTLTAFENSPAWCSNNGWG